MIIIVLAVIGLIKLLMGTINVFKRSDKNMKEKIVIALGGNAIQTKEATAEAQQTAIRRAMQNLKPLFDSPARIVISHGNGPQIGSLLIQQAKSNSDTPAMPLDTCGAMSQGMIGYWLETEINRILTEMNSDRTVGTIVTRVEVDKDDPRFNNPTKPIGPFYTKEEVEELQKNSQTQSLKKMQDVVIEK